MTKSKKKFKFEHMVPASPNKVYDEWLNQKITSPRH
jgi:hypothetical protein